VTEQRAGAGRWATRLALFVALALLTRALETIVRSGYRAVAALDGVWIWRRKGCESAALSPE
jgi:hypothetical protein